MSAERLELLLHQRQQLSNYGHDLSLINHEISDLIVSKPSLAPLLQSRSPSTKFIISEWTTKAQVFRARTMSQLAVRGMFEPKNETKFDQLTPVTFRELLPLKRNRDSYILCKIMTPPFWDSGVVRFILVDTNNETFCGSVYNSFFTLPWQIDAHFWHGRVMAWISPVLDIIRESCQFHVRCDNIENIINLDFITGSLLLQTAKWPDTFQHDETTTWELWFRKGNQFSALTSWSNAIHCFDRALEFILEPECKHAILCARSRSKFRCGQFVPALQDAEAALALVSDSNDAICCAGDALLGLENYRAALEKYRACNAEKKVSITLGYIAQSEELLYEWQDLAAQAMSNPFLPLDIANYCSKSIVVKEIPNKGRGMVATERIISRGILVVERAMAVMFEAELGLGRDKNSLHEINRNLQYCMARRVQAICEQNSLLNERVSSLCAGHEDSKARMACAADATSIPYLSRVLDANSFCSSNQNQFDQGLFNFMSMFNHSCCPNVLWIFINSIIIAIALRDILPGEELTISYICVNDFVIKRRDDLKQRGFSCNCHRCEREGEVTNLQIYEQVQDMISNYYESFSRNASTVFEETNEWLAALDQAKSTIVDEGCSLSSRLIRLAIQTKQDRDGSAKLRLFKQFVALFDPQLDLHRASGIAIASELIKAAVSLDKQDSSQETVSFLLQKAQEWLVQLLPDNLVTVAFQTLLLIASSGFELQP
jgi:hypothetical protein